MKICAVYGCENFVHRPGFKQCYDHYFYRCRYGYCLSCSWVNSYYCEYHKATICEICNKSKFYTAERCSTCKMRQYVCTECRKYHDRQCKDCKNL